VNADHTKAVMANTILFGRHAGYRGWFRYSDWPGRWNAPERPTGARRL